jgi:hypothetical protein
VRLRYSPHTLLETGFIPFGSRYLYRFLNCLGVSVSIMLSVQIETNRFGRLQSPSSIVKAGEVQQSMLMLSASLALRPPGSRLLIIVEPPQRCKGFGVVTRR